MLSSYPCSFFTELLLSTPSFAVQTLSSANKQPQRYKITAHQKTHVCPRNAIVQADLESGIPSQPQGNTRDFIHCAKLME